MSCIKSIILKEGDLLSYETKRFNNVIEIVYCIVCKIKYNKKNSKNIVEWIDIDVLIENKISSIIINKYNASKVKLIQSY